MPGDRIIVTNHALVRFRQRGIGQSHVEEAIANPAIEMPGTRPGTTRVISYFSTGRRLGVIYKRKPNGIVLVITAYWIEDET